jgi:hypothetical protein
MINLNTIESWPQRIVGGVVAMILWYLDLSFVVFVGGVVAMILW